MRALIVDDSQIDRVVLQSAVEHLGHAGLGVADAEAAWRALDADRFDVVLTDWLMPGCSGPELCQRIRARDGADYVFTVLLTGLSDRGHGLDAVRAGADVFLTKPLDLIALEMALITAERVTAMQRELIRQRAAVERLNAVLEDQVRTDPLTGAGNRHRLAEDLTRLGASIASAGDRACAIMCDVDRFKAYNDRFGHLAGDRTLQAVAEILGRACRATDTVYRFGGEELLVLLPGLSAPAAAVAAERLRRAVEEARIPHPDNVPFSVVTLSLGIAELAATPEFDPTTVLQRADRALYRAKAGGRNRSVIEDAAP